MKQIVIFALFLFGGFSVSAQNTPNDLNTDEIQEKMQESFSELQSILDTMDFSQIFGQDFNQLFGENFSGGLGLDSLGGLDINELLGEDMFQMFGEAFPQGIQGEEFQKLMEESMKMLEQIDMSELQGMFEGMDFNFEGLEDMMKDIEIEDEKDSEKDGDKKKKRKTKKI